MLSWAFVFFLFALITGIVGFGTEMGTAAWIAKLLFTSFLVLVLVTSLTERRTNA